MTPSDYRALAASATPGPWTSMPDHPLHERPYVGATGHSAGSLFVATTATDDEGQGVRDAAFIAAHDPSLLVLMWDAIEAAQVPSGWYFTDAEGTLPAALDALAAAMQERTA